MTTAARGMAFIAIILSIVPVASVAAYALLPPPDEATNNAASIATWTYLGITPICAGLAMLLGRGTAARRDGAWTFALWVFVIAFLVYQLAFY